MSRPTALTILPALLAAALLAAGCRAIGSGGRKGFGVMKDRVQVVLQLDCQLGRVIFVEAVGHATEPLECRNRPHIFHFTVPAGVYSLSYQDALEGRTWRQWSFKAERGQVSYWGDIHILPRMARVTRNAETRRAAEGLTTLPVRYAVEEGR